MRNAISLACVMGLALALGGCAKKTADLELDAARAAMDAARRAKAKDCAKQTFMAAESALAEARRLADDGEIEEAQKKAKRAQALAEQAEAASPKGCDEKEEEAEVKETEGDTTDANMNLKLEDALETVYFDYNEATIRADSRAVLEKVAQILGSQPDLTLEVEGHADVRGSTEYNLHLGERRARSVLKYLVAQGAKPDQVKIISYGEEKPADFGTSESAHQANRRGELKKL